MARIDADGGCAQGERAEVLCGVVDHHRGYSALDQSDPGKRLIVVCPHALVEAEVLVVERVVEFVGEQELEQRPARPDGVADHVEPFALGVVGRSGEVGRAGGEDVELLAGLLEAEQAGGGLIVGELAIGARAARRLTGRKLREAVAADHLGHRDPLELEAPDALHAPGDGRHQLVGQAPDLTGCDLVPGVVAEECGSRRVGRLGLLLGRAHRRASE